MIANHDDLAALASAYADKVVWPRYDLKWPLYLQAWLRIFERQIETVEVHIVNEMPLWSFVDLLALFGILRDFDAISFVKVDGAFWRGDFENGV